MSIPVSGRSYKLVERCEFKSGIVLSPGTEFLRPHKRLISLDLYMLSVIILSGHQLFFLISTMLSVFVTSNCPNLSRHTHATEQTLLMVSPIMVARF